MAKKTTKVTKAPAPAKEPKTLPPAKKPAKIVPKKTPVAPAAAVPVVVTPKEVVTTITANFDVGFGNTLYLRGEGPGLSWDHGIALDNAASDQWSISFGEATRPITFKFLINDEVWSGGEDYVVAPGASITLTPVFPGW